MVRGASSYGEHVLDHTLEKQLLPTSESFDANMQLELPEAPEGLESFVFPAQERDDFRFTMESTEFPPNLFHPPDEHQPAPVPQYAQPPRENTHSEHTVPDMFSPGETEAADPDENNSFLSAPSPYPVHAAQRPVVKTPPKPALMTEMARSDFLKPVPRIRKPQQKKGTGKQGPLTPLSHTNRPSASGETTPRRTQPGGRNTEEKRLQHNHMMRMNRERANQKFSEMEAMLESCVDGQTVEKPMRNKMQILDRVMKQYPAMLAKRASLKSQLALSACPASMQTDYTAILSTASSLKAACEIILRMSFGILNWKYGEVYLRHITHFSAENYTLVSAEISPQNMLETRHKLESFAASGAQKPTDALLHQVAKLGESRWVPDLRTQSGRSLRSKDAKECGISTALYIPVVLQEESLADAIIVLYHADDELVSYGGNVRPYDSDCVIKLDDFAGAISRVHQLAA